MTSCGKTLAETGAERAMLLQVVSAIGAAESKPFDVGAPKRIDGDAAIRLVKVAAASGVQQFTMVTALGTGKFGWPASECAAVPASLLSFLSGFQSGVHVVMWCDVDLQCQFEAGFKRHLHTLIPLDTETVPRH